MTEKKLIAVVGATGSRGGGLVRAILADPDRRVRRSGAHPQRAVRQERRSSPRRGPRSSRRTSTTRRACVTSVEGAYGAYVVTNYWAERTPEEEPRETRAEMELAQAEIAAGRSEAAGVEHVIWSTLEDTRGPLRRRRPRADCGRPVQGAALRRQGRGRRLFIKYGVPTTFLRTTFYFEGIAGWARTGAGPERQAGADDADGRPAVVRASPSRTSARPRWASSSAATDLVGKTVSIAGDHLTGDEYAAALTEALGETVVYRPTSWDDFRRLDFPGAVEMAQHVPVLRGELHTLTSAIGICDSCGS